ncbi:hypothetical protein EV356DRAFT_344924 [Viridothelium virens]|uniref:Uncharacterized protein n=1 Tax=Viridothelium virens TaxID=1048519 RepID=A0A6A6GX61_VIRVR|nr:hypothetical protein EV356DRAFT_344924 [Viridothelium virens]
MAAVNGGLSGNIKSPFFNANYDHHDIIRTWISAHDVPESFHYYFFTWAIRVAQNSKRPKGRIKPKEREILEGLSQDTVDGSTFVDWLVYYERDLWRKRNLKRTYTTYKDPNSITEDSIRERQQMLYDLLHQTIWDKKRKFRGLRTQRKKQRRLYDRRLRQTVAGVGTLSIQNHEASAQDTEMGDTGEGGAEIPETGLGKEDVL